MKQIPPELEGEYIIRILDMPEFARGFVKCDSDGFANIYINAKLNDVGKQIAADHEMTHVINDDFYNDDDIRTIEARADGRSVINKTIPKLMKARDLIPKQPPKAKTNPEPLNRHQIAILSRCISELDSCFYGGFEFFGTQAGNRII